MPKLQIDLQDGFEDDRVEVTANGEIVLSASNVRTRTQISLARLGEPRDLPEGPLKLDVRVPNKGISASQDIDFHTDTFIGVSIAGGTVRFRISPEPMGYV